jgi:hypothetical protein
MDPKARLVCLALCSIPLAAAVQAQQTGSVIGWGNPVLVAGEQLAQLEAISAGTHHGLGLLPDGSVVAWGNDQYGQCQVPVQANDCVAVEAGFHHSLALRVDGSVLAWGSNFGGESDLPDTNSGFVALARRGGDVPGPAGGRLDRGLGLGRRRCPGCAPAQHGLRGHRRRVRVRAGA